MIGPVALQHGDAVAIARVKKKLRLKPDSVSSRRQSLMLASCALLQPLDRTSPRGRLAPDHVPGAVKLSVQEQFVDPSFTVHCPRMSKLEGRTRAARLPATAPPTGPATNVPAPVMALRPTDLPIFIAVAVPKDDSLLGGGGGPEGRGAAHCSGPTLGDCSFAPSALDPLWQAVRIAEKVTSRLILVRDESTCLP